MSGYGPVNELWIGILNSMRKVRYQRAAVFVTAVVTILSVSVYSTFVRADVAPLYAATCLGGWQNTHLATGMPDAQGAFTVNNSARLPGDTHAQIYCAGFAGDMPVNALHHRVVARLSWGVETAQVPLVDMEPPSLEEVPHEQSVTSEVSEVSGTAEESLQGNNGAVVAKDIEDSSVDTQVVEEPLQQEVVVPSFQDVYPEGSVPSSSAPTSLMEKLFSITTAMLFDFAYAEESQEPNAIVPQSFIGTDVPSVAEEMTVETVPTLSAGSDGASFVATVEMSLQGTPNLSDEGGAEQELAPEPSASDTGSAPGEDTVVENDVTEGELLTEVIPEDMPPDEVASSTEEVSATPIEENVAEDALFELLYTLDGATWHTLGFVTDLSQDDTFEVPAAAFATHEDFARVQIALHSQTLLGERPTVLLDALWLEVTYDPNRILNDDERNLEEEVLLEESEAEEDRIPIDDPIIDTDPLYFSEPQRRSVRTVSSPVYIDSAATHGCSFNTPQVNISGVASTSAVLRLNSTDVHPREVIIGSLPVGVDVRFSSQGSYTYTPSIGESEIPLSILNETDSQKGDFMIPIIFTLRSVGGSSSVICQLHLNNL